MLVSPTPKTNESLSLYGKLEGRQGGQNIQRKWKVHMHKVFLFVFLLGIDDILNLYL